MKAGDFVRMRKRQDADVLGITMDDVGEVLAVYDLAANPHRVDVQFSGIELRKGWSVGDFIQALSPE